MWVAGLYKDKGASLAQFIIDTNYKTLPFSIFIGDKKKAFTFGGMCPKLKAIACHYNIPLLEGLLTLEKFQSCRSKLPKSY